MKIKYLAFIMLFSVITSDGDLMALFIFSDGGLHQVLGGVSAALDRDDACWKALRLTTGFYTMARK